jgi:hypothetical protein
VGGLALTTELEEEGSTVEQLLVFLIIKLPVKSSSLSSPVPSAFIPYPPSFSGIRKVRKFY